MKTKESQNQKLKIVSLYTYPCFARPSEAARKGCVVYQIKQSNGKAKDKLSITKRITKNSVYALLHCLAM